MMEKHGRLDGPIDHIVDDIFVKYSAELFGRTMTYTEILDAEGITDPAVRQAVINEVITQSNKSPYYNLFWKDEH